MNLDEKQVAASLAAVSMQLRGLLSNLGLSAGQLVPADRREHQPDLDDRAAAMDQCYYRILRVLNNLSDAAYLSGGKELNRGIHDMAGLVETFCEGVVDLVEDQGLDLRYSVPGGRVFCTIDAQAIRMILYHLLSNALKFTPAGGVIHIDLRVSDAQVLLSVTDNGAGVPEEQVPLLFTRFLHPERMDPPPHGLGLGLPLCRCIAEGHGGTLLWQSRPGRGSRFTLALPKNGGMEELCIVRDVPVDSAGGHNAALLGLADALDIGAFRIRSQE